MEHDKGELNHFSATGLVDGKWRSKLGSCSKHEVERYKVSMCANTGVHLVPCGKWASAIINFATICSMNHSSASHELEFPS